MKTVAMIALAVLCGCSDHPDGWEFSVYAPKDSTPEKLLGIEHALMSNGYKRVRISVIDYGREVLIRATRKEGGAK